MQFNKIDFKQARAISIHPEGKTGSEKPYVTISYTDSSRMGEMEKVGYDFLAVVQICGYQSENDKDNRLRTFII